MISLYFFFTAFIIINAQIEPNIPQNPLPPKEVSEPYREQNLCAFLKPSNNLVPYSFWTCNAPFKQAYCGSETTIEYKCCPGYIRNPFLINKCGESKSVWKLLPNHLDNYGVPNFSSLLRYHTKDMGISDEKNYQTYTVFAPYSDSTLIQKDFDLSKSKGDPHPIMMHISKERIYSSQLKDKVTINTLYKNQKLKVTSYSNGLVFINCRALVSPDHEASNGVIHFISKPIEPHTSNDLQRKSIIQALENEPLTNSFFNDIPMDIKTILESDTKWYTVFAPNNDAWSKAKSQYPDKIPLLVKNHILKKMICAQAITKKSTSFGPSLANEYLGVDCSSSLTRSIVDACGDSANIVKEDLVTENGVIQVIDKALIPTSVMSASEAVSCISKGNPKLSLSKFIDDLGSCDLKLDSSKKYIVLVPTDKAFESVQNNPDSESQQSQMPFNDENKCNIMRYHVLKMKNKSPIIINQKMFPTNFESASGKPLPVMSYFVKYRDGSKLFFNAAKTIQHKPRKFAGGYLHFVDRINLPPTKTMMQTLSERSDVSVLEKKLKDSGYDSQLGSHSPNVVFLAWQNHGWETRKEKDWSLTNLQKLFQLHTIKLKLWCSDVGYFHPETISTVNSALTKDGSPFELQIKRDLNGNTYIGYQGLPYEHWSMVIDCNLQGTDGMVWIIDWPLRIQP